MMPCPHRNLDDKAKCVGVQKQADTQHAFDFCQQNLAKVRAAGPLWNSTIAVSVYDSEPRGIAFKGILFGM